MKRPHKNPTFRIRFTRMAEHVLKAADEHCRQNQSLVPKQHREKYL
jgi:hypothetical protein